MSSIFTALEWPFGIAAGTAVGGAVAGGITPGVQSIINEANAAHAVKPPAYQLLAAGVSEGKVDPGWAAARAAEQGIGGDAFSRLVAIAEAGPGVSLAFELWRRNLTGFLSDPAPLILTTLGSVAGIAGLTALMRRIAPNLFCRNTTNVTQRICAADPLALERLLAMTLGFAILLDPAAVLRAGQAVEETIDGVIREMAGV